MERSQYQAAHFETLARETAHAVGCEALRWWQDKHDPHRLVIKALAPLGTERSLVVNLEAILPKQTEPYPPTARAGRTPPVKKPYRLSLLQRP
jgi:hypothetical protein